MGLAPNATFDSLVESGLSAGQAGKLRSPAAPESRPNKS
jgi:hypothetical protein